MDTKELNDVQKLLDSYEKQDLEDVKRDIKELQSYSDYAGTTPTEKKIINNAALIAKSMINNNDVYQKILDVSKKVFESTIKMDDKFQKTESRINDYLASIKNKTDQAISDYRNKIFTNADSQIQTYEQNQINIYDKCIENLKVINESNNKIISQQQKYLECIENLKEETIKSVKRQTFISGLILIGAISVISILCCAATFIVFSVIPQIQKAFELFGFTAGAISIIVIAFGGWLLYCFVKGRR